MKKMKWCMSIILITIINHVALAQGPPITSDKAIMLSADTWVLRTLTEVRNINEGTFVRSPLMIHYLPSSKTLVGLYIPFVNYNYKDGTSGQHLGDLELVAKYQFYRKDETGKTFRMVAKTLQTIPTGKKLNIPGISTGYYQGYFGIVAGYETIKYGISNELGYGINPLNDLDELRYKLGFGLPLLKPTYPVKQVNLYFEYQSSWFTEAQDYVLTYAQGIQYAVGQLTLETAIQIPLVQTISGEKEHNFSWFVGGRYIF